MGACATKPKVAKDEGQAPQPAQEEMPAATEVKKAVAAAVGGVEDKQVADEKEIGEGDQPEGDKVKEAVVVVVDADKVVDNDDDDQGSKRRSLGNLIGEKNGEKQSMDGGKEATEQVKSENEKIIGPLTQEPSVTGGPTGLEKQVQSLADTAPAEPVKLDKSGTEKFVLAPEMLPAEEKFDSPKRPTPAKAAIDAPGKVEAEKLIEGTKSG